MKPKTPGKPAPWPADAVERRPVERLIANARNARVHSDAQVKQIAASIEQWGWTVPVLVDEDGKIIAGHGRVLAAKQLGLAEIPVMVARGWTADQKRAYMIADNQLALNATWDDALLKIELGELRSAGTFDMKLLGFDNASLEDLLAGASGASGEDDPIPPLPTKATTRPGDLWLLGEHRLLCGDSTKPKDVRRLMNGKRAVLFATDPPYLVDYTGMNHPTSKRASRRRKELPQQNWSGSYVEQEKWDDASKGDEFYAAFMRVAIAEAITETAPWYCWHASRRQAMLEAAWESVGVFHHQQIIWVKTRGVLTRSIYMWQHEPCLMGWVKGKRPRINRKGQETWPTTVWQIPSSEIESKDHPTSKPVRVFTLPMELHASPGEICYEPFSGSGSQHIAGERTGRLVYGMEISPGFCDVVVKRWQALTGKAAILDGTAGAKGGPTTFDALQRERGTVDETPTPEPAPVKRKRKSAVPA